MGAVGGIKNKESLCRRVSACDGRARAEARNIMGHVFGRAALMTRFRGALDAALSPQTLLCRLRLRHRFTAL